MIKRGSIQAFVAGVLLLAALPVLAAKVPAQHRTGPDSFLPWRAYSVDYLVDQVQSDPIVRKRLACHFHVSEDELVSYFRTNLREVTIEESGWRPVYGVTRTGMIYRSRDYFHKGSKAFGLANGTPILKYACGNPLVTQLPPVPRKKIVGAPPVVRRFVTPPQTQIEIVPELQPIVQSPEELALLPDLPLASILAVPPAVPSSHRFIPLFWWPSSGGDHHHEVPEPTTLILLGGGLAALGTKLRRRR